MTGSVTPVTLVYARARACVDMLVRKAWDRALGEKMLQGWPAFPHSVQQALNPGPAILSVSSWIERSKAEAAWEGSTGE